MHRTLLHRLAGVAALGLLLGACGDDGGNDWDTSLEQPTVIETNGHFALVNGAWDELELLTPSSDSVAIAPFEAPGEIVTIRGVGDERIALITRPDTAFHLVDPATGNTETWPLDNPYDAFAVSDDGRFVVLYTSPSGSGDPDSILFNPNAVTVIDRDAPADAEPRTFSLTGPRPQTVTFAPAFTLLDPDAPKHMAVITGQSAVSFVDLTTDEDIDRQRLVRLTDPSTGRQLTPRSVVFSSDDPGDPNDVTAFVLASGSAELFAIDLLPADPATGREIQPAINQITTVTSPNELHRFVIDGREKLLVTGSGGLDIAVVDVRTNAVSRVQLDRPLTSAELFEEEADGAIRPRAILYRPGDALVYFAELDAIERQGMGALRARTLGGAVNAVEILETGGSRKALARYTNNTGLSVINIDTRTEVPIPARVQLGDFVIAGDLFFAVVPGTSKLGVVDLLTESVGELDLPAAGVSVHAALGANALLVVHDSDYGHVSVLSLATFTDGPHTELRGLFFDDLFDREF